MKWIKWLFENNSPRIFEHDELEKKSTQELLALLSDDAHISRWTGNRIVAIILNRFYGKLGE